MSCSCSRLTHPSCFCLRSLPPVSHKKIATSETPVETCAAQASLTKTGMNPGDCLAETWVQSEMTWNAANLGECCTVTYSLKTLGTARSKQRLHRRTAAPSLVKTFMEKTLFGQLLHFSTDLPQSQFCLICLTFLLHSLRRPFFPG